MATQKKTQAQKKSTTAKKAPKETKAPSKNTRQAAKATEAQTAPKAAAPIQEKKPRDPDGMLHQLIPCVFIVGAVILCVFLAVGSNEAAGAVGGFIRRCAYGLFGYGAWILPASLAVCAFRWKKTVTDGGIGALFALNLIAVSLLSALLHAIIVSDTAIIYNPVVLFEGVGGRITVGGVVGGIISNALMNSIQKIATYILLSFFSVIIIIFALGLTPRTIWLYIRYKHAIAKERAEQRAEEREAEYRAREAEYNSYVAKSSADAYEENNGEIALKKEKKAKKNKGAMLDEEDLPDGADAYAAQTEAQQQAERDRFEINMFTKQNAPDKDADEQRTLDPIIPDVSEPKPIEDLDLRQIFLSPERADELPEPTVEDGAIDVIYEKSEGNAAGGQGSISLDEEEVPEELEAEAEEISSPIEKPKPEPVKVKPQYRFPPISLLAQAAPVNESGAQEELTQNAKKLVDTLLSFKVKTKILSVSRGPTITRYELSPEAGTRVRSIANLVDDIALNLATSGVRIEAPIPGKSAVGIEVPNKTVSTVRLRELIDAPAFKNADSKLNVALGVDVAGSPVYCNIAKMPHMLIAGATGMGKSVCINSIISSILYKASPDDVKLILVDPKKVEFNIYNGLPHLLVPVVSDPQKAAGSLNWAVGEMERRFTLIDEVGVRDIGGYNEITKDDPDREPMPYVVIIIDELADLMMTAPDAVETSICRLAQKARAAGMHLVIGTQRPSVDVITGLIKANIPSRIAFTVASQVDSKTIIDIGGAEKLIGRGDMLYAPVGFMKPLRVQGAFVSDEEVRAVTDFIRSSMGNTEYDSDIIYSIEREAERCAQKGKGAPAELGDDDELRENVDPKFREALEVAVNSGKISTSLLQRHLSIGYGRAAKIIDRMQALGYVSPPDGTKPREVLITKQMYMEMVVNNDEF